MTRPAMNEVYAALAARARTVAGLGTCARVAAAASAVFLGLAVPGRLLGWPLLGVPGVSLALVAASTLIGYLVGRARPADLPRTLLRADVGLGTEARLSTLHAIQDRQDLAPFALRIAAGLPARPVSASVALPIPRRVAALLAVAATMALATVIAVSAIPRPRPPASAAPSAPIYVPIEVPPRAEPAPATASDALQAQAARDDAVPPAASSAPLADASSTTESSVAASDLPTRPQSALTLEETLQRIEERVAADPGSALSDAEREALATWVEGATDALAEAIRDLLAQSARDNTLAQVRAVLARPDVHASPSSQPPAAQRLPAPDTQATTAGPESVTAPSAGGGPASGSTPGRRGGAYPFFDEGAGGPTEITLVGATLPSTIGTAGDYSYYVTRSVPVEPPPDDPATPRGTPLALSYERASAIAAGRALPSDVLEAVRAYFTEITEGGL